MSASQKYPTPSLPVAYPRQGFKTPGFTAGTQNLMPLLLLFDTPIITKSNLVIAVIGARWVGREM